MREQRSLLEDLGEEVTGIVAPVSLCMAVTVLLVRFLNPEGVSSTNTVMIASIAYQEQEGDSSGKKFGGALLNALIFVGVVAGMTVILFLLFKYKCYKFIFAYMGFAVFNIFFFITGALFIQCMQVMDLHIDAFSLAYGLFNFSIVGTLGLLFMPIPLLCKQVYLIWVGIIVAYIFTFIPEWTAWVLLVMMALYDIAAVLMPGGPLKALVELAVERQQELPALIYEARPAGGRPYVRGWGRRGEGPGSGGSEPQMQVNPAALEHDEEVRNSRRAMEPPPGGSAAHREAALQAQQQMMAMEAGLGAQQHGGAPGGRGSGRRGGGGAPQEAVGEAAAAGSWGQDSQRALVPGGVATDDGRGLATGGSAAAARPSSGRPSSGRPSSGRNSRGAPGPVGEGNEKEWQRLPSSPRAQERAAQHAAQQAAAPPTARSRLGHVLDAEPAAASEYSERSSVSNASQEPLLMGRHTPDVATPAETESGEAGPSDPRRAAPGGGKGGSKPHRFAPPGAEGPYGAGLGDPRGPDRLSAPGSARVGSTMGVRAVAPAFNQEQLATAVFRNTLDGGVAPAPLPPPVAAANAAAIAQAQDMRERREMEEEQLDLPDSIKLGLGDFIFYSMLVGRAAMYDFMTVFACYLAIIAGLGLTLLCLAVFQKALPALPFSIALGVIFYFLTRLALEPYMVPLFSHLAYY